ncbi:MAG: glycosyltransferase family 39 protein [Bacteroidales bacterium]|nr:glycosyltransferase family 39 protein [Bacteroidales bacterium]MCF8389635.1 glycosyltransferase family 39 protein [Bacteroidales bacterium]
MLYFNYSKFVFARISRIGKQLGLAFLFLLFAVLMAFSDNLLLIGFYLYSIITMLVYLLYFVYFPRIILNGQSNPNWTIFINTFSINLIFTACLLLNYYFNVQSYYGPLYGYDAGDSTGYNYITSIMAEDFWNGTFNMTEYVTLMGKFSDMGYVLFLFPFYTFIGPYLWVAALVNVIFISLSVVLVYKIAFLSLDRTIATISVSLLIAFPQFFLYSSTSLKEIPLIWLLLSAVYYGQKFILYRFSRIRNILLFIAFTTFIALFRTFLTAVILISFFSSFVYYSKRKKSFVSNLFLFLITLVLFLFVAEQVNFLNETAEIIDQSESSFVNVVARRGGSSLSKMASLPVALTVSVPGPFATFVKTTDQPNIWLSGIGSFIRNTMIIFFFIGIYHIFKHNLKKNMFLILLFFSYVFVVAYSGFFTSTRYQLISAPLFMIISAVGIIEMKNQKLAYLSILFMTGIVIFWNYMKIRGYS